MKRTWGTLTLSACPRDPTHGSRSVVLVSTAGIFCCQFCDGFWDVDDPSVEWVLVVEGDQRHWQRVIRQED